MQQTDDRDDRSRTDDRPDDQASEHVERTTEKPVERWVTGDEPMTGAQRSYLDTLAREAGEDAPDGSMTKAEASRRIDELQDETGRGADQG